MKLKNMWFKSERGRIFHLVSSITTKAGNNYQTVFSVCSPSSISLPVTAADWTDLPSEGERCQACLRKATRAS